MVPDKMIKPMDHIMEQIEWNVDDVYIEQWSVNNELDDDDNDLETSESKAGFHFPLPNLTSSWSVLFFFTNICYFYHEGQTYVHIVRSSGFRFLFIFNDREQHLALHIKGVEWKKSCQWQERNREH